MFSWLHGKCLDDRDDRGHRRWGRWILRRPSWCGISSPCHPERRLRRGCRSQPDRGESTTRSRHLRHWRRTRYRDSQLTWAGGRRDCVGTGHDARTWCSLLKPEHRRSADIFSLLFGEVLGVSSGEILPIAILGVISLVAIGIMYRPLLLSSLTPEIAEARGLRTFRIELLFLLVVAVATTMTVPVVGALLIFTLMIGPPAAARCFTHRPGMALLGSVAIAIVTIWLAIAAAYWTNWPVGFRVGIIFECFVVWCRPCLRCLLFPKTGPVKRTPVRLRCLSGVGLRPCSFLGGWS